ncbi:glycerol-3-phosphate phosphatase [Ambystoma mexicanum]|uniref:glycerol-3-phosphate phosphatase n=1 Tax=Ambystoma mexicanum TaxID=8296 RepID=UPI0037E8566C
MASSKCVRLAGAAAKDFLSGAVDTVLFDCDGVIWRGDQVIPGAPEVINGLKRAGKQVFFITNNSTKTREMYAEKLSKMGFVVEKEEVFGTAFCTAIYLRKIAKLDGKVYLIGGKALSQEFAAVGIPYLGPGPDLVTGGMNEWANVSCDPEVRAVVVGFDEHFSYMKLTRALGYLRNPTCLFLATNTDTRLPLEGGRAIPGTGCLVKAVETAAHRQAQIVGKPTRFILDCVASEYPINPARTVMVGDRLDTDILMGTSCGLKTILTLTGFSTLEDAQAHLSSGSPSRQGMVPDYYVDTIADLLPALQG